MAHFGPRNFRLRVPDIARIRGRSLPFHNRNRAPTGIGALSSLQSLVAVSSDAVLPERRKPRGVDRGFPRIGLGSAKREPVRMKQARSQTKVLDVRFATAAKSVRLVAGKFLLERVNNQLRRRQILLVRVVLDVELGDVESTCPAFAPFGKQ